MKYLPKIKQALSAIFFSAVGMILLGGIWQLISNVTKNQIPSPQLTWNVFKEVVQNPMQNDPDIKGIGTKLLSSLGRVAIGFGLGSLVAIPLGMLMGSSKIAMKIVNPIVQILRPVSPLAWFPLGLAIFQDSPKASIFMIFICCLWPTLLCRKRFLLTREQETRTRNTKIKVYEYINHFIEVTVANSR
jgi:nitrate/nitrite transport system permease protein